MRCFAARRNRCLAAFFERLKIKNERLGEVLVALEGRRAIVRVAGGYVLAADQS